MISQRFRLIALVVVIALFSVMITNPFQAQAQGGTLIVSSTNLQGWIIFPDGVVPYAFAENTASTGVGSLEFGPIDGGVGANKFVMFTPLFNVQTDDFGSLSYDFYVNPASPLTSDHFYANVYVDDISNGIGTTVSWYDCRYAYVPPTTAPGVWGTGSFDSTFTGWVVAATANLTGTCGASIGANGSGSVIMDMRLNGGDSSVNDGGLMGAFDNVVIDFAGVTTTYDFEMTVPVIVVPEVGIPVANEGMIQINAYAPVPALGSAGGEQAKDSVGVPITLPHDWDSNGFDTYVVTSCKQLEDGTIWTSIWLGSENFGWVQLFDGKVQILSEGLPASCLP